MCMPSYSRRSPPGSACGGFGRGLGGLAGDRRLNPAALVYNGEVPNTAILPGAQSEVCPLPSQGAIRVFLSHERKDDFVFLMTPTMASSTIAPAAAEGFRNASAYDAHRPSYPTAAVRSLLAHMRLANRPQARVVEVAAGTGKFTEALTAQDEGFEVLATEPHPRMRAELQAKGLPGVAVREGKAEDLRGSVEAEWADGVVAAQAFHW